MVNFVQAFAILTTEGSQLSADKDGTLLAKSHIRLDVATSTSGQKSAEKRKGAELNAGKGSAGAYADKHLGNGETRTEHATLLSFGGNATFTSETGDITLTGTQAVAKSALRLVANAYVRKTLLMERFKARHAIRWQVKVAMWW